MNWEFRMKHRYSKRKRTICFFIGLALCGFGVALSTVPALGTSPVSSLPYVLTFIVPFSLGVWTIISNTIFLLAQIAILKKEFQWFQLSQMIAVVIFGLFIDLGMWVSSFYIPENYWLRIVEQLLGCAVLAFGIVLELIADITYLPGEGLVKAIAYHWKLNFGKVKICFDSTLVCLAILVSLFGTGTISGVREGTVIAAFAVGYLVRLYRRPSRALKLTLVKKYPSGLASAAHTV